MTPHKRDFIQCMLDLRAWLAKDSWFVGNKPTESNRRYVTKVVLDWLADYHNANPTACPIKQSWIDCDSKLNPDETVCEFVFVVTSTLTNDEEPRGVKFVVYDRGVTTDWTERSEMSSSVDDPITAYDRAMGVV